MASYKRRDLSDKKWKTIEPYCEWLMIDSSHIKVHPHVSGAKGGNQDMDRSKGGSIQRYIWPWMRMVCHSEQLLQKEPKQIAKKFSLWLREWKGKLYSEIGPLT